jgi:glycosyltransferase involved in cell wall biosynthesis
MPTIIIPAHNEENVIDRCLLPIKSSIDNNEVEVIVVCNGCTDQTASKVFKVSDKIICIETDVASKTNALNIGDEVAQYYPRFYIDADISISMDAISAVMKALEAGYMAASPEVDINLAGSSWIVSAYYDVWLSLPYCRAGMVGTGVYALSREGRKRFKRFPDIISDDGYVRCLFSEAERCSVRGYYSIVSAPKNLVGLIKIKTRSRLGRYELKEKFPDIMKNEEKDYVGAMKKVMLDVKLWPKIILYIVINIFTRLRAMWQKKHNLLHWERDDSSRYI